MAQYLGINTCITITKYVLYCLLVLYLTLIQCTISQKSSIGISDTRLLLKEDAIISLLCQVSASTTSTDVTGGTFIWKLTRNTGVVNNYDDNTVKTIARIRIESVSLNITTPFSSLGIFNSTADDSGIISCQYNYQEDSGSTQTLSVDTFVCVSTVPEPPQCLQAGQDGTDIVCYWDGICPNNDNVTLQWLDGDSMQTLNGSITRSNTTIETILVTDTNIDNYFCKLESDLYPNVQLNCSISNGKSTTTFHTSDNVIMSSRPDDVTTMKMITSKTIMSSSSSTLSIPPPGSMPLQTFQISHLIIAVCIGAGGMLLLIVIIITIYVICRKLNDDTSKRDFEVKFELDERHVHSDNEKEDGLNNPSYCAVENDKGSSAKMGTTVQMHVDPLHNETSQDALPDSSYASISDCKDEGSGHDMLVVSEDIPVYAKPDKHIEVSNLEKGLSNTDTSDSKTQHPVRDVTGDVVVSHDTPSDDMPVYAKPTKTSKVDIVEEESLKSDLEPVGDLNAYLKPQHRDNIKSDVNDDGGHDQAYASILLSDPTPDSCNDNTAIIGDNLLKIDIGGKDNKEADNTSNNPIYFELEKS